VDLPTFLLALARILHKKGETEPLVQGQHHREVVLSWKIIPSTAVFVHASDREPPVVAEKTEPHYTSFGCSLQGIKKAGQNLAGKLRARVVLRPEHGEIGKLTCKRRDAITVTTKQ
jgi:hypothetical protein